MKKRWLFDTEDQLWHLWSDLTPAPGAAAYCGNVNDENCSIEDTAGTYARCSACLDNLRSNPDT